MIENRSAHQFYDGKVIQGNLAQSYTPFREFALQIHTSMREYFIKEDTQNWDTPRTAHNGGASPPGEFKPSYQSVLTLSEFIGPE